jgi:acyl-CoA dehydrogenase
MVAQTRPELDMLRSTVRQICKKYDNKYWQETTMTGRPADGLWDEVVKAGLFGVMLPQEYGGGDMGMAALATVMEEFCNHGVQVPFIFTNSMAGITISKHGTEEQKQRYLPPIISGKEKFAFSITEPDAGTNSFKIKTLARRDGDEFVIRGQKIFSSNIDQADNLFLVARTIPAEEVEDKRQGISLLLINPETPGITWQPVPVWVHGAVVGNKYWKGTPPGQPVPSTFQAFYDDARVPATSLLGEEGRGFRALLDALNPERILAAMLCVGLGRFALSKGVEYAKNRKVFGDTPIGAYQGLAHPMALAKTHLELAALMAHHAAEQFDAGADPALIGMYANMAKMAAADAAIEAVDVAIQVHGGIGFSEEVGLVHLYPHVRLYKTTPVSKEMVLNYIAEHVLGLPRSY